jgi:hypothetical protein
MILMGDLVSPLEAEMAETKASKHHLSCNGNFGSQFEPSELRGSQQKPRYIDL